MDRHGDECRPDLAHREVVALERIALEAAAIQDTLQLVADHLLGGLSAEQLAEAREEARLLRASLRQARLTLTAALRAASPPKESAP